MDSNQSKLGCNHFPTKRYQLYMEDTIIPQKKIKGKKDNNAELEKESTVSSNTEMHAPVNGKPTTSMEWMAQENMYVIIVGYL